MAGSLAKIPCQVLICDDEERHNNHWWQYQSSSMDAKPCPRCQYDFYVGTDGRQRQAGSRGQVDERRWSCIRSFQKAGNCKVALSNGSELTRLLVKGTKTRPRRGHDRSALHNIPNCQIFLEGIVEANSMVLSRNVKLFRDTVRRNAEGCP